MTNRVVHEERLRRRVVTNRVVHKERLWVFLYKEVNSVLNCSTLPLTSWEIPVINICCHPSLPKCDCRLKSLIGCVAKMASETCMGMLDGTNVVLRLEDWTSKIIIELWNQLRNFDQAKPQESKL